MLPIKRLQASNTKENLWIYILSFLKERKLYAWEIPGIIEKKFNFKPGKITPYRVLYRLQKQGFVKSKMEKTRRIYQITQKGEKQLKQAKQLYKQILNKLN